MYEELILDFAVPLDVNEVEQIVVHSLLDIFRVVFRIGPKYIQVDLDGYPRSYTVWGGQ
jgi:hypothetical protein